MSFVEEFRKNIPFIADEMMAAFGGYSDTFTLEEAYNIARDVLTDWLNEYQTDEAQNKNKNHE